MNVCMSQICRTLLHTCGMIMFAVCFFKQKTAYEMRISDWSSDVCSSDLLTDYLAQAVRAADRLKRDIGLIFGAIVRRERPGLVEKIGRASCRERVCQYV